VRVRASTRDALNALVQQTGVSGQGDVLDSLIPRVTVNRGS
jgi:hypothetical protein